MKNLLLKTITTILIAVVTFTYFPVIVAVASESDDLSEQINREQQQLSQTREAINSAEGELSDLEDDLDNVQGDLPRLKLEIKRIQLEIEFNELQIQLLEETKKVVELEKENEQVLQSKLLKNAYQQWKLNSDIRKFMSENHSNLHPLKREYYQSQLLLNKAKSIEEIQKDLDKLNLELDEYTNSKDALAKQSKDLEEKKKILEEQIAILNGSISAQSRRIAGLQTARQSIEGRISDLTAQQRAIEEQEAEQTEQNNQSNTEVEIDTGEYYFRSYGRDLYQGHGVGLSQWGAYGGARSGMSAAQILQTYYAGTQIQTRSNNIAVEGHGTISSDAYVAGLGEVPDKACGTIDQVTANPQKYSVDNPNTAWDCWPEEAIKAQVIAARTYAINYNAVYGRPICTSAACQVYVGGNGKAWAAQETSRQVVTYNGNVIEALYSSDNNQGFGTSDNETRWSSFSGDGNPVPYLRHVNDTAFTANGGYANFRANTDGFTMDTVEEMLRYRNSGASLSSNGAYPFFDGVLNATGGVASLEFQRDGSNRVKKVIIVGQNGVRKPIAGWLFKSQWNSWVYYTKPADQRDYIYSLTFFLNQN